MGAADINQDGGSGASWRRVLVVWGGTGRWKIEATAASLGEVHSASTAQGMVTTELRGARVGKVVPRVRTATKGDKQTNMLGILDRTSHLGVVVGAGKHLLHSSIDNIASQEKLRFVSCGLKDGVDELTYLGAKIRMLKHD